MAFSASEHPPCAVAASTCLASASVAVAGAVAAAVPAEAVAAWGGVLNFLKHHPALLLHLHVSHLPLLLLLLLQCQLQPLLPGVGCSTS
jgi:hypothetical protein